MASSRKSFAPTAAYVQKISKHYSSWTGEAREALARFLALLPDQQRVLGPDHPDTLATQASITAQAWMTHLDGRKNPDDAWSDDGMNVEP